MKIFNHKKCKDLLCELRICNCLLYYFQMVVVIKKLLMAVDDQLYCRMHSAREVEC